MTRLLLELLSEEIPARMQRKAREDLRDGVLKGLAEAGVTHGEARAFSTPRRLTLIVDGLPERTPDLREERKGPRADAPEKALEGFLRSTGLTRDQLEVRPDKKGDVFFAVIDKPGRAVAEVIAELVPAIVRGFPWPKSMRWGSGDLRWVRPLHSILCGLEGPGGLTPVPFEIEGVSVGLETRGHRIHGPAVFTPTGFDDYVAKLAAAGVTLDQDARKAVIAEGVERLAAQAGLTVAPDAALLDEVSGLVEHPVPLIGEIAEEFRELPPEVLQTSMREHQKFFSLKDGDRITHFATVANIDAPDGGAAIVAGNKRVLSARLSDAKFFWENDLKTPLDEMSKPLEKVVFHAKLGSVADRVARIAALARELAPAIGADPDAAEQAARIAKADLNSQMVFEFPELQGIMGRYYAQRAGFSDAIADAARDHYKPLGPGDDVPADPVSVAVALAEKLDTLTGFWAIDEKPTGSKDPYALRRAALGVIRLILENGVRARLVDFETAADGETHPGVFVRMIGEHLNRSRSTLTNAEASAAEVVDALAANQASEEVAGLVAAYYLRKFAVSKELGDAYQQRLSEAALQRTYDLLAFFADRLKVTLRDQGVRHDVIDAVFGLGGQDDLVALVARVKALQAVLETEDGANLLAAYKRAANILRAEAAKALSGKVESGFPSDNASEKDGREPGAVDPAALALPEEQALHAALTGARPIIEQALAEERFADAMAAMASLRAPLDAFFDKVTVNADDPALRANRLALLSDLRGLMGEVADLSRIEG